ncbi:hypothetical protein D3C81_1402020 [compost metagenome]
MMKAFTKTIIRSVWMTWERIYGVFAHRSSIYSMQYGICKVLVKKYRGSCVSCEDGTVIKQGDYVAELHIDNAEVLRLLHKGSPDRAALIVARSLRKAVGDIHSDLDHRMEFMQVKALIGITLLHRGFSHGLGFEQQPIPSKLFKWVSTRYLRLLLAILHPEGTQRIGGQTEKLVPMMMIHTRSSLHKRFATT